MKLLIFGATGGTGKLVLQQALEQGHEVTALVRNSSKLDIQNARLTIIQGDVMNSPSIENAMQGQEAVICCIGSPAHKVGTLRSEGTENIIKTMEKTGVNRFICQTSLGFADSIKVLNQTSFIFKNMIVPFLLKKTFEEHELQEESIKKSPLNWTIVRPGNLSNGSLTDKYRHGFGYDDPKIKVKVSRADVADFMLKQLADATYFKKVVGISY